MPAHGERRILDMFAARAGQHDLRRRRVDPVRETKIAKLRLAGTRAAAPLMNDRLRNAPVPGQHEDFVLVPVVGRLALDVAKLQENFERQGPIPCLRERISA